MFRYSLTELLSTMILVEFLTPVAEFVVALVLCFVLKFVCLLFDDKEEK